MGAMSILDSTGDTKHEWDSSNPAEVEAAREVFMLYKGRGYAAARMENDIAGEIIQEFDPSLGSVLMIPPMQGG